MHVLFVKLTSMGDLIHALPALTDASEHLPGITFDWVIEKNFREVALWHPAVNNVITTSHRKWRKNFWQFCRNGEIPQFLQSIRKEKYDLIIDGQTSMKSAVTTLLAKGKRHGLDKKSAREWIASFAYHKSYCVDKDMHAIKRLRLLFSQVFNYPYIDNQPNYAIADYVFPNLKFALPAQPYLVFVHNASWQSKLWPESYWRQLITFAAEEGFYILLPWGNEAEKQRAHRLSLGFSNVVVLPFCSLSEQAKILKGAVGAICSDTGLSHLAAALNVPAITLYGSTNHQWIGATGLHQQHLVSPFSCTMCYNYHCNYDNKKHEDALCALALTSDYVWQQFKTLLAS